MNNAKKDPWIVTKVSWKVEKVVQYWGCLVYDFKQSFLVFKQHFTHFNTLFHPHVFP